MAREDEARNYTSRPWTIVTWTSWHVMFGCSPNFKGCSPAHSTSLAFSRGTWTWSSRARSIGVACLAQVERQGGWFDWATVGARCAVCGDPQSLVEYNISLWYFVFSHASADASAGIMNIRNYPLWWVYMPSSFLRHFCAHCCNSLYILQLCSDQSHAMFKLLVLSDEQPVFIAKRPLLEGIFIVAKLHVGLL